MKKKLLLFIFVVFTLFSLFVFSADAASFSVRGMIGSDYVVYAPGKFDLMVFTNAVEPKYQWYAQVGAGNNASYIKLDNNGRYSGVDTYHLSLVTDDGLEYKENGDGWYSIVFFCEVTDKDGSKGYGPDFRMTVFTHATLLKALENREAGFLTYGVNGSTNVREEDGIKYCDAYLDRGINFTFSTTALPSDSFREWFASSEGKLSVEYLVTEDGKTTLTNDLSNYKPKRTGEGAVSVTANLVLYINGARMETIDSKTVVVNVLVPEGLGYAYTNSSCSVLADQYSQARVLATREKVRAVHLISDKGGYYQVVVNSYVGYIPKTALDFPEKIPSVSADISEPSVYVPFSLTPDLFDKDCYELYKTEPVTWYDETSGRFLTGNDTFQPGHTYTLDIWLKAKKGHNFPVSGGKPAVSATINGRTAGVRVAYEQDPEEVIDVYYTFTHVHDPIKIAQVNPTCTTPGKKVYYRCSCGMAYEDYQAKVVIDNTNWGYIAPRGHWESGWMSNGKEHYKVCQRRECGITIEGSKGTHTGGEATCAHGAFCSVCGLEYGNKTAHSWSEGWETVTPEGHAHVCKYLCGATSSVEKHVPGPEATSTSPQTCTKCGYVMSPAVNHTHTLTKTEAKAPDCVNPGNTEYYTCSGCNAIFRDGAGKEELPSLDATVTPPLGHKISDEWHFSETEHWRLCKVCKSTLEETSAKHEFDDKGVCLTCGYDRNDASAALETQAPAAPVIPDDTDFVTASPESASSPDSSVPESGTENKGGIMWWWIVIIALAAALAAFGAVFAIGRAKKKEKTQE